MILWVRHGQSTWNVFDRMQGQAVHPPLTELGQQQALSVAELLADRGVTRIVSSPAVRATQTADAIAARLGLGYDLDPLLAEKDLTESIPDVLNRIHTFLAGDTDGTTVVVSHGDTIGLAVGLLAGHRPELPANCSITWVNPESGVIEVVTAAPLTD